MKEILAFHLNGCPYCHMWFGTDKQYEAQPGESYDQTKAYIKAVFDKALA